MEYNGRLQGGRVMVVQHNLSAMYTSNQKKANDTFLGKSMEKLSSGYQINRSADDAAGLQISEKMRWQIRGLNRATKNIQEGISCIQVADGALTEVHSMLQRMNELATQAANDTNADEDRTAIQQEIRNLAEEITRIGKTTSFNELLLFDKMRGDQKEVTSVASLVKCASATKGYLGEAYQASNGKYYSAAKLDFSGINANNIAKLYDKSFSFNCSQNCSEVFTFTMIDGNGQSDSATNLNGKTNHKYVIDIHGMKTGSEIVAKMYDYLDNNRPTGNGVSGTGLDGGLYVSHSNVLIKTSGSELWIVGNTYPQNTKTAAENYYPRSGMPTSGAIDASAITSAKEVNTEKNSMVIQSGSLEPDRITLWFDKMNAEILGVDALNVMDNTRAGKAMTAIQAAIDKISESRSSLGAQQNRLEHAMNIDQNVSENTSAAESRMRDTDMAKESVQLAKQKVIDSVTTEILRNNQENAKGVLQMLQ